MGGKVEKDREDRKREIQWCRCLGHCFSASCQTQAALQVYPLGPMGFCRRFSQEKVHLRVKTMNSQVAWSTLTPREASPALLGVICSLRSHSGNEIPRLSLRHSLYPNSGMESSWEWGCEAQGSTWSQAVPELAKAIKLVVVVRETGSMSRNKVVMKGILGGLQCFCLMQ